MLELSKRPKSTEQNVWSTGGVLKWSGGRTGDYKKNRIRRMADRTNW